MRESGISWPDRGLYAITDGPRADLLTRVEAVLVAGAVLLQYRDKTGESARRLQEATALRQMCTRHGVPLIINDDVELAAACAADGVHLGDDDVRIEHARAKLGDRAMIGVSCYDSIERAHDLATRGAAYLAFGSFFASPTKPAARCAAPALLTAAKSFGLPLVAIGGITAENGRALIAAGANFLAVISGVFAATDVAEAAKHYVNLFHN